MINYMVGYLVYVLVGCVLCGILSCDGTYDHNKRIKYVVVSMTIYPFVVAFRLGAAIGRFFKSPWDRR